MMKRLASVTAVLLAASLFTAQGQTSGKTIHHKKKARKAVAHKPGAATQAQVRELREQMQAQIDALKQQLSARDQQLSTAQETAARAQTQAATATAGATQATTDAAQATAKEASLETTVTTVSTQNQALQQTVAAQAESQQKLKEQVESPSSLHYKGVTITPVAFFAFEGVWRQRSINSDINTPFNSIPVPSSVQGHVSELNFSGRQSRLGGLIETYAGNFKLSGYFETDFLSSGTTSNNNQSNSYSLRQRQFWGKAETLGGFAVTGGQMWSLVTENGKGTDARTEKLPNTIDPQYMVGFSWTRQPGIRVQQRFGDVKTGALTVAMSLEQAQITNFTVAGPAPANFFFAGAGTGGGLYNALSANYANNVAPDVIVKGALDYPKAHFELGGIARFLRDYYFPILTVSPTNVYTFAANSVSDTKPAGGFFGSARVSPSRFADVALQGMAGQGTGRYGSSQLADATLHPSGTLEPLRNYHGLFSLETHPTKMLDVFAYYGGEYAQRKVYANANGALIGYGLPNANDAGCYALPPNPGNANGGTPAAPGNCTSPTRYIQEAMLGFTYRMINNPKYGRLQYSMTYQYLQRNLWSGVTSGTFAGPGAAYLGARAVDPMVHVGMRYYIP